MGHTTEQTTFVKDCITDALFRLMQKKPFAAITITELTCLAGVGRVSFYRNFADKQDILAQKLDRLLQEWGRDFEAHGDPTYFAESIFRHFYRHRETYLLIYRQGLSSLIYDSIRRACRLEDPANRMECYLRSAFAGMTFGMVDEWMRSGMQESPEELLRLSAALAPGPAGH